MKRILFFAFCITICVSPFAQYSYNVNAIQLECNKHQLTTNVNTQLGSVWYQTKINLNNSFDYVFDVSLSATANDGGADGIVFVLQNNGLNAIGTGGGGIGYQGLPGNSIGIEIDTWPNSGACPADNGDPALDHIGMLKNGSPAHCSVNSLASPVVIGAGGNIEDGQVHTFRVQWDATLKIIQVYFDGVFVLSRIEDMVNTIFGGNPLVYWGFVGSTGGANNVQWFRTKLQAAISSTLDTKCENDGRIFTNNSQSFFPLSKFYWYFDDGSPVDSVNNSVSHAYSAGTHFTKLKIIDINGCADSITYTEFIHPKPVAHFTWSNSCQGLPVQFTDSSYFLISDIPPGASPAQFWWRMPDGSTYNSQNVSYNFTAPGSYTIYHVSTSIYGCKSDTVQRIINIQPAPVADFSFVNNQCQNASVQFTDLSSISSGNITSWNWTFGDGNISSLQNPSNVYINPGNYTVTLTVFSNNSNCSHTISKTLTIRPKPIAYFKFGTICQASPTTLTDSSYTTDGSAITGWWWDLGNGQFSNNQNPTVTYNTAGIITVRLVVTSISGCTSDTLSLQLNVNGKPVANYSYTDSICTGATVSFTDLSQVSAGSTVNTWYWSFGSGASSPSSTIQNPTTTYSTNGIKSVKLVVTSSAGCVSDTVTKLVTIFARPAMNFTFTDSVCLGRPTSFFGSGNAPDGTIADYSWTFLDTAFVIHGQNVSHIFLNPGINTVTLNGTSSHGCTTQITKTVFVLAKPIAYFKTPVICQATQTTLQDSSYSPDGVAITGWWWDLGNGQFSTQQNPQVTYNTSGTITVKLVVQNSRGCRSDTLTKTITVQAKPVAKFGYSSPQCSNVAVQFSDTSSAAGGSITQWSWINNGTVFSTQQNPSQLFAAGAQTVGLVATSNAGCKSDTAFKTFTVNAKPDISMNFTNACRLSPVSFSATDNNATGIASWKWNFGDGGNATISNPQHTYSSNGTYQVSLSAISNAGCYSDTLKRSIVIFSTNAFAGNDTIAAAGQSIQLNGSGGVSYEWIPATGLNDPFIANPIAILTQTQQYVLKAFTPLGCVSYDTVLIKIYKGPEIYLPTAFTPNGDGLNDVLRGIPVGIKEFKYLKIYNRWGQEIFVATDYRIGWDGKWKGQKQESGIYIVIASGIDFKDNVINKKGTVMLIR